MRRRPIVLSGPLPPVELLRFVPVEWPVPPLKQHTTEWEADRWSVLGPLHAWREARRTWSAEHGDAGLGNPLERMHFERAVQTAYLSMIRKPSGG